VSFAPVVIGQTDYSGFLFYDTQLKTALNLKYYLGREEE